MNESTIYINISIGPYVTETLNLTPWDDRYVSSMGYAWDIVLGLIILFIILTGVLLNSVVLWTLIKLRAGHQRQRQLTNTDYYIIALASSDLLAVLLCYPLTFASTVSHRWLFGDVGCAINGFFGFLFSLIDIGVLTVMSVVRLLCVKMPHCALVTTPRYTMATLVGVVIYALIWTVSPLLGWGNFTPEPFGTSCTVDWRSPDRSYVTSVFACVLALPLVTMLVCYGCVVYHMRNSSARVGRYFAERKHRARKQTRLVRMAVLMCACFLMIWLPYSVLSICFAYIPRFDVLPVESAIPTVLAKTSHVINPLVYFTMNPSYRQRVKNFFLRRTFVPSSSRDQGVRSSRGYDDGPVTKTSDPTDRKQNSYLQGGSSIPLILVNRISQTEESVLQGIYSTTDISVLQDNDNDEMEDVDESNVDIAGGTAISPYKMSNAQPLLDKDNRILKVTLQTDSWTDQRTNTNGSVVSKCQSSPHSAVDTDAVTHLLEDQRDKIADKDMNSNQNIMRGLGEARVASLYRDLDKSDQSHPGFKNNSNIPKRPLCPACQEHWLKCRDKSSLSMDDNWLVSERKPHLEEWVNQTESTVAKFGKEINGAVLTNGLNISNDVGNPATLRVEGPARLPRQDKSCDKVLEQTFYLNSGYAISPVEGEFSKSALNENSGSQNATLCDKDESKVESGNKNEMWDRLLSERGQNTSTEAARSGEDVNEESDKEKCHNASVNSTPTKLSKPTDAGLESLKTACARALSKSCVLYTY